MGHVYGSMEWYISSLGSVPASSRYLVDLGCIRILGTGAYFHWKWFNITWEVCPSWTEVHIAAKELLPIVISCALWGQQMKSSYICCQCDNAAVVTMINIRADIQWLHTCSDVFHLCKILHQPVSRASSRTPEPMRCQGAMS